MDTKLPSILLSKLHLCIILNQISRSMACCTSLVLHNVLYKLFNNQYNEKIPNHIDIIHFKFKKNFIILKCIYKVKENSYIYDFCIYFFYLIWDITNTPHIDITYDRIMRLNRQPSFKGLNKSPHIYTIRYESLQILSKLILNLGVRVYLVP